MAILFDAMSDYLENRMLEWILRNGDPPRANDWSVSAPYFSLYTGDPTDDNNVASLKEANGNGYQRARNYGWYTNYVSSTGIAYSAGVTNFAVSTGSGWETITDVGICTNQVSGSLLFHARVFPNEGITVQGGYIFSILSGQNSTYISASGAYGYRYMEYALENILDSDYVPKIGLTLYAALMTTMPNRANVGGVEVPTLYGGHATGYSRLQVAGTSNWVQPISGSTYNLVPFTLINSAYYDIGKVEGMCFYVSNTGTGGELALLLPLENPIYVRHYDSVRFMPGEIKIGVA